MRALLLNRKEEVFRIITDAENPGATSVLAAKETLTINEAHTLELSVSLSPQAIIDMTAAHYIAVPVADDAGKEFHLYAVQTVKNDDLTLNITGIEAAYDELDGYGYIEDRRFYEQPFSRAAKAIFDGTRWGVGQLPEPDPEVHTNFYREAPLSALAKLVNATKVEVEFVYSISGTHIMGRTVNFASELGKDTTVRFVYGDKAISVVHEESRATIATAARGYGKGVEEAQPETQTDTSQESSTDDSDPTKGRKIDFSGVAWSVASGDPVDKPLGQPWVEIPEATAEWGYSDGTPRMTTVEFQDETDPASLLAKTYNALLELVRPKLQLSATVAKVGNIGLGDRVTIVRHDLKIYYKARCVKLIRDLCDVSRSEVSVGDETVPSMAAQEHTATKEAVNDAKTEVSNGLIKSKKDLDKRLNDAMNKARERADELQDTIDSAKKEADAQIKDIIGDLGTYKGDVAKQFSEYNDGFDLKIKTAEGHMTDVAASVEGIEQFVKDPKTGLESTRTQVAGVIRDMVTQSEFKAERVTTTKLIQDSIANVKGDITSLSLTTQGLQTLVGDTSVASRLSQFKDEVALEVTDKFNKSSAMIDAKIGQITLGLTGERGAAGIQINLPDGGQSTIMLDADRIIGPNIIGLDHITLTPNNANIDLSEWGQTIVSGPGGGGGHLQVGSPAVPTGGDASGPAFAVYGYSTFNGGVNINGGFSTSTNIVVGGDWIYFSHGAALFANTQNGMLYYQGGPGWYNTYRVEMTQV